MYVLFNSISDPSNSTDDCLHTCEIHFYNTAYNYFHDVFPDYYYNNAYYDYYEDYFGECPDYCGSYMDGNCTYYYSQFSCNTVFPTDWIYNMYKPLIDKATVAYIYMIRFESIAYVYLHTIYF